MTCQVARGERPAERASAMIGWYGIPCPENRSRPEKNRPKEQRGQIVLGGLRRQRLATNGSPLGPATTFAVIRVEHDHPDGYPYLIVVERTADGWRALHEVGTLADALHYLSGKYMRLAR